MYSLWVLWLHINHFVSCNHLSRSECFPRMMEKDFANMQWVVCDIVICQCFLLMIAFYGALNDAYDPVLVACTNNVRTQNMSACPSVSPIVSVCPLVPCYSEFSSLIWLVWDKEEHFVQDYLFCFFINRQLSI